MRILHLVHKIATWLVLAVGVIHTLATFYFFDSLTEPAVWFAGAGLGGMFAAFLNMGLWLDTPRPAARRMAIAANLAFGTWLIAGVAATPQMPSFIVATAGITMATCGILRSRSNSNA